MSTQFISRFKETTQSINADRRPWLDFLDFTAFSLPSSITDATTRITQNLTHFRVNYAVIILIIVFLSLIYHPVAIIVLLILLVAWFLLYFSREEPLVIFNFAVDDGIVVVLLVGFTIAALVMTHVWVNSLLSLGIGLLLVALHAALKATDDLVMDDFESPYGPMLAGDDSSRGAYSGI